MNKVFAVIRREFIERVRTKSFLIGTFLVPLLVAAFGYLPQLLARRDTGSKTIVVLDAASGPIGQVIANRLGADSIGEGEGRQPRFLVVRLPAAGRLEQLRDSVVATIGLQDGPADAADGVLLLTEEAVEGGRITYLGDNAGSFRDMGALERLIGPALREERLQRKQADAAIIAAANVRLDLNSTKVTNGKATGQSGEQTFWLAYIVNLLMYMVLLLYGIQVMSAVIEEKSNRIVEVLVSSMSPFQLLMGKVLGVGASGLLQLAIWGITGFYITATLASGGTSAGGPGIAADGSAASISVPVISPELVAVILAFFLLGFFLYAGLYAAIGAMCNTQQEAQQANTPVTMCIAIAMVAVFALMNDPSSTMARVFSLIPLFAPIVVPVRYAISPLPLTEVLLSVVAMVVGIVGVVWIAARIYRVGILSYGKKPSMKELWRWMRTA
ncbi:MAG: ABC transporter permease [Gemmatimonadota bacterium]|nr:ABC transporter permease [Gemmatimonadota bacterium]